MSDLSFSDKTILENALNMHTGYVLNFTDSSFTEFFAGLEIDINDAKYLVKGEAKAERLKAFWDIENNCIVGKVILELANVMNAENLSKSTGIKAAYMSASAKNIFEQQRVLIKEVEKIGLRLMDNKFSSQTKSNIKISQYCNEFNIEIREEIYTHIKSYLDNEDYFHAVEEAYKVVRSKLKELTKQEKASDVFNLNGENNKYYEQLFGEKTGNKTKQENPKYDFYRGVGYLHLAIQFLRNEKVHMLAHNLDKNLAFHYLVLASLAYSLIVEKNS